MTVLFEGGRFTAADAAVSALVLSILVAGLPAYVMIKVLAPGFFARKDMWTPLWVTVASLAAGSPPISSSFRSTGSHRLRRPPPGRRGSMRSRSM
jgi:hypothetical protein